MSARSATTGPSLPPLSTAITPVRATPSLYLEAEFAQVVGNEACGPRLLLAELGMLMNIAPPGDQLVLDLGGALADFFFKAGTIDCGDAGCDQLAAKSVAKTVEQKERRMFLSLNR